MSPYKRILREITEIYAACASGEDENIRIIETDRDEGNLYSWTFLIRGPQGTPYLDGVWRVRMLIPGTYPSSPPYIRFEDSIIHPNVSLDSGEVCIDILKESWKPTMTLRVAILGLISILHEPNAFSPLNIDASNLYKTDRQAFNQVITFHKEENSKKNAWPEQQRINKDI